MAAFSKRHYNLVAASLHSIPRDCSICGENEFYSFHVPAEDCRGCQNPSEHHVYVRSNSSEDRALAEMFRKDNPAFDRDHFLAVIRGERDINSRPPRS